MSKISLHLQKHNYEDGKLKAANETTMNMMMIGGKGGTHI